MPERRRQFIVDTDIGTDVDDALAIALLCGSPLVDLKAITTTYADTELRARIALRLMEVAKRPDVPVIAGDPTPLSDDVDVFWMGHEGRGFGQLGPVSIQPGQTAEKFLADAVRQEPRAIDVLCIGPLGNVARAIVLDNGFSTNVAHLWVMGGDFGLSASEPEHNWKCDPRAAALVVDSGSAMTICGIDQTERTRISAPVAQALEVHGELGKLLAYLMREWWTLTAASKPASLRQTLFPHDAAAALMALRPDLFEFCDVELHVHPTGPTAGSAIVVPSPGASIRIVVDMDHLAVSTVIEELLLRAALEST